MRGVRANGEESSSYPKSTPGRSSCRKAFRKGFSSPAEFWENSRMTAVFGMPAGFWNAAPAEAGWPQSPRLFGHTRK